MIMPFNINSTSSHVLFNLTEKIVIYGISRKNRTLYKFTVKHHGNFYSVVVSLV